MEEARCVDLKQKVLNLLTGKRKKRWTYFFGGGGRMRCAWYSNVTGIQMVGVHIPTADEFMLTV